LIALLIPLASADIITPGFEPIGITNQISNIQDYPDHVFLMVSYLGGEINNDMCSIKIINSDGIIPGAYKFCDINVYAIEKSKFNQEQFDEILNVQILSTQDRILMSEQITEFLSTSEAKEVISDIEHYRQVPITSTIKSKTNYYEIDLSQSLTSPTKITKERSTLFYLYIIIPIIAIAIIIFLVKRRNGHTNHNNIHNPKKILKNEHNLHSTNQYIHLAPGKSSLHCITKHNHRRNGRHHSRNNLNIPTL
jgi:hypothetical protein